ncbi:hypothetical protein FWD20_00330 [Candidatus Saccharibacteria bacterium]|nr:hypothetical protein [Candidatus Saccharibacteria bacterium]
MSVKVPAMVAEVLSTCLGRDPLGTEQLLLAFAARTPNPTDSYTGKPELDELPNRMPAANILLMKQQFFEDSMTKNEPEIVTLALSCLIASVKVTGGRRVIVEEYHRRFRAVEDNLGNLNDAAERLNETRSDETREVCENALRKFIRIARNSCFFDVLDKYTLEQRKRFLSEVARVALREYRPNQPHFAPSATMVRELMGILTAIEFERSDPTGDMSGDAVSQLLEECKGLYIRDLLLKIVNFIGGAEAHDPSNINAVVGTMLELGNRSKLPSKSKLPGKCLDNSRDFLRDILENLSYERTAGARRTSLSYQAEQLKVRMKHILSGIEGVGVEGARAIFEKHRTASEQELPVDQKPDVEPDVNKPCSVLGHAALDQLVRTINAILLDGITSNRNRWQTFGRRREELLEPERKPFTRDQLLKIAKFISGREASDLHRTISGSELPLSTDAATPLPSQAEPEVSSPRSEPKGEPESKPQEANLRGRLLEIATQLNGKKAGMAENLETTVEIIYAVLCHPKSNYAGRDKRNANTEKYIHAALNNLTLAGAARDLGASSSNIIKKIERCVKCLEEIMGNLIPEELEEVIAEGRRRAASDQKPSADQDPDVEPDAADPSITPNTLKAVSNNHAPPAEPIEPKPDRPANVGGHLHANQTKRVPWRFIEQNFIRRGRLTLDEGTALHMRLNSHLPDSRRVDVGTQHKAISNLKDKLGQCIKLRAGDDTEQEATISLVKCFVDQLDRHGVIGGRKVYSDVIGYITESNYLRKLVNLEPLATNEWPTMTDREVVIGKLLEGLEMVLSSSSRAL